MIQKLSLFAAWMRPLILPRAKKGAYPPSVRIILTLSVLVGISMVFLAPFVKPIGGFETLFWHRSYAMGLGGAVIAAISAGLRCATKSTASNTDWLRLRELVFLIGLALLVVASDIHYSQKIGLLAYPPYYDGVSYMFEAKYAFLHLGMLKQHPIVYAHMTFGNRYPIWTGLMVTHFAVFGVGEWQSYAVRFWPTLAILIAVFWVVRRRASFPVACAAALFTAILPTLSLNLRSAALGQSIFPHGYLADLRPDILFAAFVTLSVVLLIEHAGTFDEWTASLSGVSAALAMLTKSTTIFAVVLAWSMAVAYVLCINRRNVRKTAQIMLWALLPFTILLMPWLLSGGFEKTIVYVRQILTSQLPRYSDAHPTFRGQSTYYWFWLIKHMGWATVVFVVVSSIFLFLFFLKGKAQIHHPLAYLLIAAALYLLVCVTPAKNYFLGLPCYLVLWIYCWVSLISLTASSRSMKGKFSWGILSAAIVIVGVIAIEGVRNTHPWKEQGFGEGQQDRAAFQQIAIDLRRILSNEQSFIAMPAYGDPATLLFYMPDQQGRFPQPSDVNGTNGPPIQEFIQQVVEPAKAILVYSNGDKPRGWAEVGFAEQDVPYFRAIAAWVRRPGSSHHLVKTYNLSPEAPCDKAAVELYVRND